MLSKEDERELKRMEEEFGETVGKKMFMLGYRKTPKRPLCAVVSYPLTPLLFLLKF